MGRPANVKEPSSRTTNGSTRVLVACSSTTTWIHHVQRTPARPCIRTLTSFASEQHTSSRLGSDGRTPTRHVMQPSRWESATMLTLLPIMQSIGMPIQHSGRKQPAHTRLLRSHRGLSSQSAVQGLRLIAARNCSLMMSLSLRCKKHKYHSL